MLGYLTVDGKYIGMVAVARNSMTIFVDSSVATALIRN